MNKLVTRLRCLPFMENYSDPLGSAQVLDQYAIRKEVFSRALMYYSIILSFQRPRRPELRYLTCMTLPTPMLSLNALWADVSK